MPSANANEKGDVGAWGEFPAKHCPCPGKCLTLANSLLSLMDLPVAEVIGCSLIAMSIFTNPGISWLPSLVNPGLVNHLCTVYSRLHCRRQGCTPRAGAPQDE